ncbi:transcription antitermination factor NusB [candidate division TA06 bacterium]|uniref:Transcription antitermination protein NusB n=1 Tax=candidate division TA06 bacterium TaxID=2250710 RepID=A0A933MK04_UNCT6|nr:transcription antitermination factor NusB [candidate division TA06 bacterium]
MSARHKCRELALQALYQMEITGSSPEEALDDIRQRNSGQAIDFTISLVQTVAQNAKEIDQTIERSAKNWKLSRMAVVDRNILRLGVAQLRYLSAEVPPKVAIDESIELGKKFGDGQSGRFINGILDNVYKELAKPV